MAEDVTIGTSVSGSRHVVMLIPREARTTGSAKTDGSVSKALAGRTRRNPGLPNAICRPCSQVQPLVHSY